MSPTNLPAVVGKLPMVKSQEELSKALSELREHCNLLVPEVMNFGSPLHKVALEVVQIDTTIDANKNGIDIYSPDGGERFTLHYKAANKIAGAAGIQWLSSTVTKRDTDDTGRVIYVEHSVEWEVKKPTGAVRRGSSNGYYRYEEDRKRFDGKPKQIESRRRFAEALAESNAKLRAIFEALESLPRHFTLAELKKPFLVPCVVEDLSDLIKDDPEAKRMVVAHHLGITDQVYGPSKAPAPQHDAKDLTGVATATVEEKVSVDQTTGEIKLSEKEYKDSWKTSSRQEKLAQVEKLLQLKGYAPPAGTKTPDQLSEEQLVGYLWFLQLLPDKPVEAKLPWGA